MKKKLDDLHRIAGGGQPPSDRSIREGEGEEGGERRKRNKPVIQGRGAGNKWIKNMKTSTAFFESLPVDNSPITPRVFKKKKSKKNQKKGLRKNNTNPRALGTNPRAVEKRQQDIQRKQRGEMFREFERLISQ